MPADFGRNNDSLWDSSSVSSENGGMGDPFSGSSSSLGGDVFGAGSGAFKDGFGSVGSNGGSGSGAARAISVVPCPLG